MEVIPPTPSPSPESMAEVMTGIKRCCDVAHSVEQAIKNPAGGGVISTSSDWWIDLFH